MADRNLLLNKAPWRADGKYVLYWAQMNRRVSSNHALSFAVDLANREGLPVLVYEGLTCEYPYANDRFHTFVLEGVPDTAARLEKAGIGYLFHLRRRRSDPNNALYRLAKDAAAVVTDDYPVFIARTHNRSVPAKLDIPVYAVDASCIVPMANFDKQEYGAYTIRPKIRKVLDQYLQPLPALRVSRRFTLPLLTDPQTADLHSEVTRENIASLVACCEIDHTVGAATKYPGGSGRAEARLRSYLENNLRRYARYSNQPSARATSGLSPYLHFGHISSLDIALAARDYAAEHEVVAEEFLEQLIVRRELAFNFARFSPSIDSLEALPSWARATLAKHDGDPRAYVYSRDDFDQARTHDALWNAAQTELVETGLMHGYYRMYWGKKIIEWSASHAEALATMIELNDRYALDGRDPNTYTNILWCLGLHDRPWAERSIFGMVRFMSLDGMKRKTDVDSYIRQVMPSKSAAVSDEKEDHVSRQGNLF
ncbi:MAG: deoxyribodipyrimidine photo-lyase [Bryobacteraceae bacterium]